MAATDKSTQTKREAKPGGVMFYHVNNCTIDRLESLLNAHAERGWRLNHVRGTSNDGRRVAVLFEREFTFPAERDAFIAEREARRKERRQQEPAAAPPEVVEK